VPLSKRLEPPRALSIRVIWTGSPARTSSMVSKVRTLRSFEPRAYGRRRDAIVEATEAFLDSLAAGSTAGLIEAISLHHRALAALGEDCGAPIVEDRLRAIAGLATQHGGAAKPSGAGGGDVALAFFPDSESADAFSDACRGRGLHPLDLLLGADGVRLEAR
jgi:phosphomevalonate kinase